MNFQSVVFGVLFMVLCVDAKRKRGKSIQPGNDTCLNMTNSTKMVSLKCKSKRDVIYNMVINGYTSKCGQADQCPGLQPDVLTTSNNCYWNRRCYIRYSSTKPIVRTDDHSCIGHTPSSLSVQFSCIKKKKIIYLGDGKRSRKREVKSYFGMIVSHLEFPWHYRDNTMKYLKLKPRSQKIKKLFLTVQVLDIDSPKDVIRLRNGKTVVNIMSNQTLVIPTSETELQFFTNSDSSGGQGFVACFYWAELDDCEEIKDKDICDVVRNLKRKPNKPCKRRRSRKRRHD